MEPVVAGFTNYLSNVGQLNNRGVELELRTINFANDNFNWTTVFNLSHNKNKIVSLNGQLEQSIEGTWFIHKVGLPYHTFYVKEYAGVNPDTGKAMYYRNQEIPQEDGTVIIDRSLTENAGEAQAIPYKSVNPNASIDLQTSDSTSGMTGAMDGTFAIGMASRELKDEEAAQLTGTAIALDGIAVIVNPANTIDELSMDQIKSIYVGDITDWGDLA